MKHTCSIPFCLAGFYNLNCLLSTRLIHAHYPFSLGFVCNAPPFLPPALHLHSTFSLLTPPLLQHWSTPSLSLPLSAFAGGKTQLLTSKSYSDSSWIAPSLLSHTGFDATLQMRFSTLPSPLFTWRREIPMQLPILYSISSSGEVTLALHGWQSTFLQNCIVIGQTQHCQSRRICGATQ